MKDKSILITINPETKQPNYKFEGDWDGRTMRIAVQKSVRAYRNYISGKKKEIEAIPQIKELENDTTTKPVESGRIKRAFTATRSGKSK